MLLLYGTDKSAVTLPIESTHTCLPLTAFHLFVPLINEGLSTIQGSAWRCRSQLSILDVIVPQSSLSITYQMNFRSDTVLLLGAMGDTSLRSVPVLFATCALTILYFFFKYVISNTARNEFMKEHSCQAPAKYPHRDPFSDWM